jgi:AICAR transformylase/IMP cyclohydrolase PurH
MQIGIHIRNYDRSNEVLLAGNHSIWDIGMRMANRVRADQAEL